MSVKNEKKVPGNIFFDDRLMFVPTYDEAGIPRDLGALGRISVKVKLGQWVSRGETLLEVEFSYFKFEQKPSRWQALFWEDKDPKLSKTFELKSPASGLVLGFRELRMNEAIVYIHTIENILPVLLLPKDEPSISNYRLGYLEDIGLFLGYKWPFLLFPHVHGYYQRLGERAKEKDGEQYWSHSIQKILKFKRVAIESFPVYSFREYSRQFLHVIQDLRAHDLELRDKLVHLTRL